jgi:hypothetical protein
MGNKASKVHPVGCRYPDRGTLDTRAYQLQLISRAIEILDRELESKTTTAALVNLQQDIMKYRDENGVEDPVITDPVRGKVAFKPHEWEILLKDPLLIQWDRQNPFELFRQPISDLEPVGAVKERFRVYRDRFDQARDVVTQALTKDCK